MLDSDPLKDAPVRPDGWKENGKRACGPVNVDLIHGEVQFAARGPLDIADTVVTFPLDSVLGIAAEYLRQSGAMVAMARARQSALGGQNGGG